MRDQLMPIESLMELLGYTDTRSVKKWCEGKIPLIEVGKRTYTIEAMVDAYFESEFKQFVTKNYPNPDLIIEAVQQDDKEGLAKLMNAPLADSTNRKEKTQLIKKKEKEPKSKAAQRLKSKFIK